MSAAIECLREAVLADPVLQERLRGLGPTEFVIATVTVAGELGLELTEADVEEGLRQARREWLERWI
jgi:hypothetical protein